MPPRRLRFQTRRLRTSGLSTPAIADQTEGGAKGGDCSAMHCCCEVGFADVVCSKCIRFVIWICKGSLTAGGGGFGVAWWLWRKHQRNSTIRSRWLHRLCACMCVHQFKLCSFEKEIPCNVIHGEHFSLEMSTRAL